jgi:lysophospholipase L1-like esterase
MKTILLYLVALCALFSPLRGQESTTVRVACVGNSITAGYGLKKPSVDAYPAVLQRILGADYEVRNFGHSGRTLLNHGDRPFMKEPEFRNALAFLPNIVTIKLGTNDSKPNNWTYREEFQADLEAMIDSFQLLPSHPQIYLCLPIPAVIGCGGITDSIIHSEVIPQIEAVAKHRHLPLIDLYTPLKPFPELLPDSIHPDRAGACIIAEEIARRLMLDRAQ